MQKKRSLIDFSTVIEPFDKEETCGDFNLLVELDNCYFMAIGDVGGHGSVHVGNVANLCKDIINENISRPLDEILLALHSNSEVRHKGLVLLLSKIYKHTPILEYVGVGNLAFKLIRNSKIVDLAIHEGIVGYQIPRHLTTNIMKFSKNDRLIIATDGLSIYNEKIKNKIQLEMTSKELSESIMKELNRKHDDALCAVLTYNVSDSHFLSIKNSYQGT